jgi:hypothetical protein
MKRLLFGLSLALLVGLTVPIQAQEKNDKQALVIIACKAIDWTGKRPLPENVFPTKDWRDVEVYLNKDGEAECKREVVHLEDAALFQEGDAKPLNSDFSDKGQCSRASMLFSPTWNQSHKGWLVVTTGCPTPIKQDVTGDGPSDDDITIGYKMPECPSWIRCNFDESQI